MRSSLPYPFLPTDEPKVWTGSDGSIWYVPGEGKMPQCLSDANDVCGIGIFNTGRDDPAVNECNWHDKGYQRYKIFESFGWDRKDIDEYFLYLRQLRDDGFWRTTGYYFLVRAVGWAPFYWRKTKDKLDEYRGK